MSHFSSPAFRIFNAENSDRTAVKPGGNGLQFRRPFVDRSVNCNTPDANRLEKKASGKKPQVVQKGCNEASTQNLEPNLEIDNDIRFSYKEISQDEDFLPYTRRIELTDVYNNMKSYLNKDSTPPPSPTKFEPFEINNSICDDSFKSVNSYDGDMSYTLELPEFEEVEMPPPIDFDALCL